jgi:phage tail sheath protein FI
VNPIGLAPGVHTEDVFPPLPPTLPTGVPAFLGTAAAGPPNVPVAVTHWSRFQEVFGAGTGYLGAAVAGFFGNDGLMCWVVRLDDGRPAVPALRAGLAALSDVDDVDLVCVPDAVGAPTATGRPDVAAAVALQAEVLADCRRAGGRFAVLDAVPALVRGPVEEQRAGLSGADGALYHPWLLVSDVDGTARYVPPCGHVAGAYSRSDQRWGVHKAPANEPLDGVLDLMADCTDADIGALYAQQVNCLRDRPGRGIRVWGARTLSADPVWQQVTARRVVGTTGRWLRRFLDDLTYEPNDLRLWVRVTREVTAYLDGMFARGAFAGATAAESYYVKCDAETNPPDVLAAGLVVTQVGLALRAPAEFVVVRVVHGAGGVTVEPTNTPTR